MAKGQLVIWSARQREWLNCPPGEITWLDRALLSAGKDPTLHRSPRCAGFRYVHYRWELFSRDTTHKVYLAPFATEAAADYRAVQVTARHVLPMAPAAYETLPVRLDDGSWLVSVGKWVLPLSVDVPVDRRDNPTNPHSGDQSHTQQERQLAYGQAAPAAVSRRCPARPARSGPTSTGTIMRARRWPTTTSSSSSARSPRRRCR